MNPPSTNKTLTSPTTKTNKIPRSFSGPASSNLRSNNAIAVTTSIKPTVPTKFKVSSTASTKINKNEDTPASTWSNRYNARFTAISSDVSAPNKLSNLKSNKATAANRSNLPELRPVQLHLSPTPGQMNLGGKQKLISNSGVILTQTTTDNSYLDATFFVQNFGRLRFNGVIKDDSTFIFDPLTGLINISSKKPQIKTEESNFNSTPGVNKLAKPKKPTIKTGTEPSASIKDISSTGIARNIKKKSKATDNLHAPVKSDDDGTLKSTKAGISSDKRPFRKTKKETKLVDKLDGLELQTPGSMEHKLAEDQLFQTESTSRHMQSSSDALPLNMDDSNAISIQENNEPAYSTVNVEEKSRPLNSEKYELVRNPSEAEQERISEIQNVEGEEENLIFI